MHTLHVAAAALLAPLATARVCTNLTIPITATARNAVFDLPVPTTNADVMSFILKEAYQGENYTASVLAGYQTLDQQFNIAATYCHPNSGPSSTLQVLSHGLGFDRFYWDLSYNNYNYSYVSYAVDTAGFSTLAFDQIGVGGSSVPDPIQVVQSFMQVGVLQALTRKLRAGTVSGISTNFTKITHVGHSIGSITTYAMSALTPSLTDGITLTGFAHNATWAPLYAAYVNPIIASGVNPYLYGNLPNCYIIAATKNNFQATDFGGAFDPQILDSTFAQRTPVTCGDRLTLGSVLFIPSSFTGPVHIVDGNEELLFCNGNCNSGPAGYSSIPASSRKFMPSANPFQVDIIDDTGSALNVHYSAHQSFSLINNFIAQNGLAPKRRRR